MLELVLFCTAEKTWITLRLSCPITENSKTVLFKLWRGDMEWEQEVQIPHCNVDLEFTLQMIFNKLPLLKFAIIPKNIHHYLKQLLKKPLLFQTYVLRFLCTPKTKQDIILSNMQKQNREFG